MSGTVLQSGPFADVQELGFQTAKRSDMGCAELQGGQFSNSQ